MSHRPLPIDPVLPAILDALAASADGRRSVVVEAPPGAGKTTRVPRALLDAGAKGEILVLEPRRLAARLAARRVAEELGERLGETVGYTVRFDDVSSAKTRIRFVTEGVLTRRWLADPELRGIDTVVLDEFHERHLQGDVAIALLRRLQRTRRPDLRLVAMSATLDAAQVASFLESTVVRSEGRAFDVAIEHLPAPDDRKLDLQVASAVRALVQGGLDGHVLVFLPGAAAIRHAMQACDKLAREHDLVLLPLHGDLSPAEQDRAVAPSARRKVILSTNVAESSVTIDDVAAVIDSGLVRVARHAPWSGLPTLGIEKASRASLTQRAGRAGRTRAGRALRLFTRADFDARPEHDTPEVHRIDLAQTVLELRAAGAQDVEWLDPPKPAMQTAAETLLVRLGAFDEHGALTDVGRRMLAFPLHPRQARVLVEAERRGVGRDGAAVAALLGERDLRTSGKTKFGDGGHRAFDHATERSDLLALLDLYREVEASSFAAHAVRAADLDMGAVRHVAQAVRQLERLVDDRPKRARDKESQASSGEAPIGAAYDDALLLSVLSGFPDRVARRKSPGSRELAMAEGGGAELAETSVVRDAPWMVAATADVAFGKTKVRTASAIEPEWLIELFDTRIREIADVSFDEAKGAVVGSSKMLYESLAIVESPGFDARDPRVADVLFEAVKARGFRDLCPDDALDRWLARVRFAAEQDPSIEAPTDADVEATVRELCVGKSRLDELRAANVLGELQSRVGAWGRIDELAPERITLASGRKTPLTYEPNKPPWIASYLQDFFGMTKPPMAGRVPIVLHLLAPNKRAVQVTTDLAGFWERHYPAIRRELMRKYPRHPWPEDTHTPIPMRTRR